MRDYRILEGLFFHSEDKKVLRDRIRNTETGKGFVKALEAELEKVDQKEYHALRFDWYAYNPDIDHSTSVDNYQNINGKVSTYLSGIANRAYLHTLALELLDKKEYREAIRQDMLRLPREYPLHLFVMVDMGLVLYSFLKVYLFVLDAERDLFTEQEQFILDNFARSITMDIIYEQEEWLRSRVGQQHCNNHMVAHSQAAIFAGLYYHRADWVKYGLENPEGIYTYLEDGMMDKGMGIEASLTYNLMSLVLMMETADYLKRAGHQVDLYHMANSKGCSLKSYFETAMHFLTTGGRVTPIGDCYARITYLCDMEVFHRAYVEYGSEIEGMDWIASHAKTDTLNLFRLRMGDVQPGEKPDAKNLLAEEFGAMFIKSKDGREFWDSDAISMAVRTGHGMIHGNCDHMAVLLFKGENYILRDFEGKDNLSRHAFSGHITRTLNRSRLAHCAVMIDGRDSRFMNQEALKSSYERGDGWQRIVMEDTEKFLYDGVWQKRTLMLRDNVLEDLYEVECDDEHDMDYIVHIGDSEYRPAFEKKEELLEQWFPKTWPSQTLEWMRDAQEMDIQGGVSLQYPGVKFEIAAMGAKKALLFTLPEADDLSMGGSHSVLVRVSGKKARFVARYAFV